MPRSNFCFENQQQALVVFALQHYQIKQTLALKNSLDKGIVLLNYGPCCSTLGVSSLVDI
jgi:hypothetical protein